MEYFQLMLNGEEYGIYAFKYDFSEDRVKELADEYIGLNSDDDFEDWLEWEKGIDCVRVLVTEIHVSI